MKRPPNPPKPKAAGGEGGEERKKRGGFPRQVTPWGNMNDTIAPRFKNCHRKLGQVQVSLVLTRKQVQAAVPGVRVLDLGSASLFSRVLPFGNSNASYGARERDRCDE